MSVPATLLLMQVSRGSASFGGGLPPEDKRTEKQKRRDRILCAAAVIVGVLCGIGLVVYIAHSTEQSFKQLRTLYAQKQGITRTC